VSGKITQDIPYALIPRWVIQALGLDLSALAVYCALAAYASSLRQAFPGIRRLAADMGCSSKTVRLALNRLETAGAIVVTHGGPHRTNSYFLPFEVQGVIERLANVKAVDKSVDKPASAW